MSFITEVRELIDTFKEVQRKAENVNEQVETCLKPALKDLEKKVKEYQFEIAPRIDKINEKLQNISSLQE